MTDKFEELATGLAARTDRPLTDLEGRVWAAIARRDLTASPAIVWGWRSAAAALVVAIGVMVEGAATANDTSELALFSSRTALAPSTLLGEDR